MPLILNIFENCLIIISKYLAEIDFLTKRLLTFQIKKPLSENVAKVYWLNAIWMKLNSLCQVWVLAVELSDQLSRMSNLLFQLRGLRGRSLLVCFEI